MDGETTVRAHRIETRVGAEGTLILDRLPFGAGEAVEVIVLPRPAGTNVPAVTYPLRGTPVRYERPFEGAVSAEEWDADR